MSEDKTTQPVVDDTKAAAKPDATVDSARNDGADLESLLAQFEQQTTKPDPVSPSPQTPATQQQTTPAPTQPDPAVMRVINRIEREDISRLVNEVRGDSDIEPDLVEAWIDAQARKDIRLQRAWLERDVNPQAFQNIAKGLAKEFAKRASKRIDPQVTEDRAAVAAAVRGASTHRAPETPPPNYAQQSNAEYRRSVREQYGFDPGV